MRSVLIPLFLLIFISGVAMAESQDKAKPPKQGFNKEKVVKMRGGKFTRMFISMIQKTKTLDLNEDQRTEVNKISSEYTSSIGQGESRSRSFQIQFMKLLKGQDFDPKQLKEISKEVSVANQKTTDTFIEGLEALQKAVGPDKFTKLTPVTKIDRSALIQLRQENAKEQTEAQKTAADNTEQKDTSEKQ